MKEKKKIVYLLTCILLVNSMCSSNVVCASSKKIVLNKSTLTLVKNKKYALKLKGIKKKKKNSIKWTTSNKKVASVKNGIVKARKTGKCKVIAKYSGKRYACFVHVKRSGSTNMNTQGNLDNQISLKVNSNIQNNTLVLTIYNHKDTMVITGRSFTLEKLEDKTWRKVSLKKDVAFTAEGMIIDPNDSTTMNISLDDYFDNIEKGRYRISKEIYSIGVISTEFVLE